MNNSKASVPDAPLTPRRQSKIGLVFSRAASNVNDDLEENSRKNTQHFTNLNRFKQESSLCDIYIDESFIENVGKHQNQMKFKLAGSCFFAKDVNSYKAESDFLWLRHSLQSVLPGVLVPDIPLQYLGGATFLENKKLALEIFLRKLIDHPVISHLPIFRQWLIRTEGGLNSLKQEFENFTVLEKLEQFSNCYYESHQVLKSTDSLESRFYQLKSSTLNLHNVMKRIEGSISALSDSDIVKLKNLYGLINILASPQVLVECRKERLDESFDNVKTNHVDPQSGKILLNQEFLMNIRSLIQHIENINYVIKSIESLNLTIKDMETKLEKLGEKYTELNNGKQSNLVSKIFRRESKIQHLENIIQEQNNTAELLEIHKEWRNRALWVLINKESLSFCNITFKNTIDTFNQWLKDNIEFPKDKFKSRDANPFELGKIVLDIK